MKGDYLMFKNAPAGSTIERRADGRMFVWYPRLMRVVLKLDAPATCPTCGQAVGHPEQDMRTVDETLDY